MKLIWLKLSDFEWWHQVWDLHQLSAKAQQGHFVGPEHDPCVWLELSVICAAVTNSSSVPNRSWGTDK